MVNEKSSRERTLVLYKYNSELILNFVPNLLHANQIKTILNCLPSLVTLFEEKLGGEIILTTEGQNYSFKTNCGYEPRLLCKIEYQIELCLECVMLRTHIMILRKKSKLQT
jgi:hypothetical protein